MVMYGIYSQTVYSLKNIRIGELSAAHDMLLAFTWILPYLIFAGLVWTLNKHYKRVSFMPWFLCGLAAEFLVIFALNSMYFHNHYGLHVEAGIPVVFVTIMAVYSRYYKMSKLLRFCYLLLFIWFISVWEDNIFDVIPS